MAFTMSGQAFDGAVRGFVRLSANCPNFLNTGDEQELEPALVSTQTSVLRIRAETMSMRLTLSTMISMTAQVSAY